MEQEQHIVSVTRDEYEELQQRMSDYEYINDKFWDTIVVLNQRLDDMKEENEILSINYLRDCIVKKPTLIDRITRFFAPLRSR
jgi:hypothetical protein